LLNQIAAIHGTGVSTPAVTPSYESIATVLVGSGGQAAIDFTSIPSTYKHLQIRAIARDNRADSGTSSLRMQFNADTGSNYYTNHRLVGAGSGTAVAGAGATGAHILFTESASGNSTANCFSSSIVDILDYTDTNKYKTTRTLHGAELNDANGATVFRSGLWMSSSAINAIKITHNNGSNLVQYSHFALYGIKG